MTETETGFEKLKCRKCDQYLTLIQVSAEYLGYRFSEKIPVCPQCGQIYISEELVRKKISQVEGVLEVK